MYIKQLQQKDGEHGTVYQFKKKGSLLPIKIQKHRYTCTHTMKTELKRL